MYVLVKIDSPYLGYYVARSGSKSSYTKDIVFAKKYETKQKAVNDSCIENERAVNVFDILR